jgi:hypothetical protein
MTDQTTALKAKLFVYDLDNSAKEHWFKPDEGWEVSVVTDVDKSAIEKKYYPTVSAKYLPELLAEMLSTVKSSLKLAGSSSEPTLDTQTINLNHLQYLIAYNPKRLRT